MSIPMQLLLIVAAFSVCFSEGAPDGRIARAKQQRPTRGFKNLEMMTARGFGKRGRPSPRTERDVHAQTTPQRTYRATPTYKSPSVNYAIGIGKRKTESDSEADQTPLQRTYRLPTFRSATNAPNFAIGNGKRTTEMEPEADFPDQSPLERTPILERIQRTPTFTNKTPYFAIGPGKRATERDYEADFRDQRPLERTYRTPTFKSATRNFAYGPGKRTTEIVPEGDFDNELLPERTGRTTRVLKTPGPQARDHAKRSPEIVPEDEEYRIRRTDFKPDNQVRVAIGYGKRPIKRVYGLDNFWETLASPEREGQEMEDDKLESIPMDWFVNEIVNNPDFARSVLRKFVDLNQDGMLSSDELLRNV